MAEMYHNYSLKMELENMLFKEMCISNISLTETIRKPRVEMTPAMPPTMRAPYGWTIRSAQAPMATPPASVAF